MKIVFAHNVYNRLKTLKNTILIEKKLYPDARITVAYNDTFVNIFYDISNFSAVGFNEKTHKIGCVNGCINSIQQVLDYDFDVLVFSHDDIYINELNVDVVYKHIDSIVNGEYDIICRKPVRFKYDAEFIEDYYMMDVFYASKKAITTLFTDIKPFASERDLPKDKYIESIAPEVWFCNLVSNKGLKINEIRYDAHHPDYNEQFTKQMGYYHLNNLTRGWRD